MAGIPPQTIKALLARRKDKTVIQADNSVGGGAKGTSLLNILHPLGDIFPKTIFRV